MIVGIIGADTDELQTLMQRIPNAITSKEMGWSRVEGTIARHQVVALAAGVGKVRATAGAQMLVSHCGVNLILMVGTAGGIDPNVKVGDIILSKTIRQYDFGLVGKGWKKDWSPVTQGSPQLLRLAVQVCQGLYGERYQIFEGNILTGDLFVADADHRLQLHRDFDAHCIEMEGAGPGVVCDIAGLPFLAIRVASDTTYHNSLEDYRRRLPELADQIAKITIKMIEALPQTL